MREMAPNKMTGAVLEEVVAEEAKDLGGGRVSAEHREAAWRDLRADLHEKAAKLREMYESGRYTNLSSKQRVEVGRWINAALALYGSDYHEWREVDKAGLDGSSPFSGGEYTSDALLCHRLEDPRLFPLAVALSHSRKTQWGRAAYEVLEAAFNRGYRVALSTLFPANDTTYTNDVELEVSSFEDSARGTDDAIRENLVRSNFLFAQEIRDPRYHEFIERAQRLYRQAVTDGDALRHFEAAGLISASEAGSLNSDGFERALPTRTMTYVALQPFARELEEKFAQPDASFPSVMRIMEVLYRAARDGFNYAVREKIGKSLLNAQQHLGNQIDFSLYKEHHKIIQ